MKDGRWYWDGYYEESKDYYLLRNFQFSGALSWKMLIYYRIGAISQVFKVVFAVLQSERILLNMVTGVL